MPVTAWHWRFQSWPETDIGANDDLGRVKSRRIFFKIKGNILSNEIELDYLAGSHMFEFIPFQTNLSFLYPLKT